MKKITTALLATFFISSSYSEVPKQPEPQEGQVAVQFVKVECPQTAKYTVSTNNMLNPEHLFKDQSCKIEEYPILYTHVGNTVTNDLRESLTFAEDYKIVDGNPTPIEKSVKLGWLLTVTVEQVDNDSEVVDLDVKFHERYLAGYDDYPISENQSVKMPKFSVRDLDSEISIVLGNWCTFGGLSTKSDHENDTITYYFIRAIN